MAPSSAQAALAEALAQRRGGPVELRAAERGEKRRILELAERNARLALDEERLRAERRRSSRVEALEGLQLALGLDVPPIRIECFDISHLGGTQTVASMVVFEGGAPKKSDYRRFKIRTLAEGASDDFAAMAEVLARRFAQWERQADISPHDPEYNASFAALPNLVVIDGGKGQLAAGLGPLRGFRERGVAVVSLAKRIEEVFIPGRAAPLVLDHSTPELQLLQRVRDEAHRFAITHHRSRRDRAMTTSLLDELPGVGPARKRALLAHFGSPDAVVAASREELQAVPGPAGEGRAGAARPSAPRRLSRPMSGAGRLIGAASSIARVPIARSRSAHVAHCVLGGGLDSSTGSEAWLLPPGSGTMQTMAANESRLKDVVVITGLLRRGQVDRDERVRGRGLLLRRQPAARR